MVTCAFGLYLVLGAVVVVFVTFANTISGCYLSCMRN